MRKLSLLFVLILGLAVTAFSPVKASAQPLNSYIRCGLMAGASFDISYNKQCLADAKTSPQTTPNYPTPRPVPSPTQPSVVTGRYVALGDSVTAGLGLSGSPTDGPCGQSTQGYPTMVAGSKNLQLTNLSCSGATMGDLVTKQRMPGINPPAQLDKAFIDGTPQLITITAGANDAHWDSFIRACYATDCSRDRYTVAADFYLSALRVKTYAALSSIKYRSQGSPPQVILTGYYNPLSDKCLAQQTSLSGSELRWVQQETDKLNSTIQSVASHYSFAKFVPINFEGHDLCSSDSWIQGLNDPAPLHPTAEGQRAIANTVLSYLQ